MKPPTREFRFSAKQFDCLMRCALESELFDRILNRRSVIAGATFAIRLSQDEAEQLRGALTSQLAQVGFDKDYSLTPQGHLLEELIDQLANLSE